jgi:CubicO group peptidase (beta-lactamase class C family)
MTSIRLLVLIGLVAAPSLLQAQHPSADRVATVVDSIVAEALEGDRAAGMSVAVERGGEVLVNRGYGWAELELAVPTPPDGIYEIGSVTKQFTAAAVLMLAAEGRLDLGADLTDYLPDYPTDGRAIPVRRLLDHTSGIRGYTEIPEFWELSRREVPRDTLVALFASEPFDFEPGEAASYNNSAYYLLGLIIEEVSGVTYEEFVQENLFGPLGMDRSSYCSERRITPGKVKGYEFTPDGLVHKDPIVHTHPYAAGSLCSSATDLVTWTRALHSGSFPGQEARAGMLRGGELNDGTRLRYGGGLSFTEIRGHPAVHHGGLIPGFLTDLAYLPEQDLIVAVLVNTAGPVNPGAITGLIVEALYGARPLEGVAFTGDPQAYVGRYQGVGRGQPLRAEILEEEGELRIRLGSPEAEPRVLLHLGDDTFALGTNRFTFEWEDGEVVRIRADMGAQYTFLVRLEDGGGGN